MPQAIEAYVAVLKQPNLPDGLRDSSLYALAQLYFIGEKYDKAIAVVQKWLAVVAEPSPEGYALLAQAYYQTQKFAEAEKKVPEPPRTSEAFPNGVSTESSATDPTTRTVMDWGVWYASGGAPGAATSYMRSGAVRPRRFNPLRSTTCAARARRSRAFMIRGGSFST